jgi:hypothetical protein
MIMVTTMTIIVCGGHCSGGDVDNNY